MLGATAAMAQTEPDSSSFTSVIVPVVGSVVGAGEVQWKTAVELRNELPSDVTVLLTMPAAPDANFVVLPIGAGGAVMLNDIAAALGVENGLSPLVVRTNNRRSVSIRATVYGAHEGKPIPTQPIAVNYGPSYFPIRVLRELSFSDAYRTNIGLANLGSGVAEFTLALQRVPGRNVAVTHIPVPPNALWHMAIQSAFPLITSGDHLTVVVETQSPETFVYASVIENQTSRAVFIQPTLGAPPQAR